jgi:hypothetical protein
MNKFVNKARALGHVAAQPVANKTKDLRDKVNTTAVAIESADLTEDMQDVAARLVVLAERAEVDPLDILANALVAHAEAKAKLADEAKAKADQELVDAIKSVTAVGNARVTIDVTPAPESTSSRS